MAMPKVCGIETEYGIVVRGAREQPGLGLVAADQRVRVGDLRARSGGTSRTSTRPTTPAGSRSTMCWPPRSRPTLVNAVLTNGARYYVDHAHPEISTPECRTRSRRCVFDRAAEEIVRASMEHARPLLARRCRDRRLQEQLRRQGQQLRLPRELPARPRAPVRPDRRPDHAALRHPSDRSAAPARSAASCPGMAPDEVAYQISQRADFFEEEVGLETTLKRPIVNTRDEPHCDAAEVPAPPRDRRRRQHERGRDLPQGRHHGDRAGDDRGRRARRRLAARQPGGGDPPGQPRPDAARAR